jgi:penicillin-binding protein 1A
MGDGTTWSPHDDDNRYFGPITLRYALAQSRNVVAVKLAEKIGVERIIEYARRMGVRESLEPNLSLALGTSVVTPLDMASGYSTLANAGIHSEPTPIRMVRDSFGSVLLNQEYPRQTEVLSAGTSYVMTSMMTSVIKEGTGYPNAEIGRPAAGKTGTTSDFRDAWFVGFTPDLVTAVWLGNDDNHPMNESYGGNIPARTWARFMKAALRKMPARQFAYPSGEVRKVAICPSGRYEYFLVGTEPAESCGHETSESVAERHSARNAVSTRAQDAKAAAAGAHRAKLSSPSSAPSAAPAEPTDAPPADDGNDVVTPAPEASP